MTELGPVSAALHAELRELARQRGIVVWLDKEGSFTAIADELVRRAKTEPEALPVRAFRGSYLETMLDLEDLEDGVAMTPLVVHVPGHTEDTIADTPLFELYRAGSRHRRALSTLVREAAAGIATPAATDAFLDGREVSLAEADAWLARLAAAPSGGGPDLGLHTAEALFDDLSSRRGPLSEQLGRPELVRALWHRAEVLLGLREHDRRHILEQSEATGSASKAELASDAATALAGWALAVEFVHDLRREPTDEWLLPLRHLPKAAITACQKLAVHLRRNHAEAYARLAAHVEALIPVESERATADDLGKIDTFRFEDRKVMEAALDALQGGDFTRAHELAALRTAGRSFWTTFDPRRRIAWHLVELAARLGCAVHDQHGLLDGCDGLSDAVTRYAGRGYVVDQLHRRLEQAREELALLDLDEASLLRARLDDLRRVYRGWADVTARVFNGLCRREGFLPPAALQQRTLFEQVVKPIVDEARSADARTAYFMVDALRFEMGAQLADALRETKTADVDLAARLAELPTITEVGMNVLAPVARDGKLTIVTSAGAIDGFRTASLLVDGPEDRRRAIHERLGGGDCPKLTLEEVLARDATSLRRSLARASAVIVHCEGIDKAGEKGVGLAVFERELQNLRAAWRVLYEAGVERFVITADHGYLLHDDVTRGAIAHGKQTDPLRRHVLLDHRRDLDGEVCVSGAELGYEGAALYVAFPAGVAPFDRGARAKDFVHGGNSLQERVIPVITVRHRHPAGGDKASYEITLRTGLPVMGYHSLYATVQPARQANLMYGSQAEVELVLEGADERVQFELCDVHHARRTGAGVVATVGQELQVFFRLSGEAETRAAVRVRAASRGLELAPAVTSDRFQVWLSARATAEVVAVAPAAVSAAPAAVRAAAPAPDWLAGLPAEVQGVFRHLADHGSINEEEATRLLGGVRQFRAFSRAIDQYRRQVPFAVRVEVASGVKCYVRGDRESS